jgi:hypothetical protein
MKIDDKEPVCVGFDRTGKMSGILDVDGCTGPQNVACYYGTIRSRYTITVMQ